MNIWKDVGRYWQHGHWIGCSYWFARRRLIASPLPARLDRYKVGPHVTLAGRSDWMQPGERFGDALARHYGTQRAGICRVIPRPDWLTASDTPEVCVQAEGYPLLVSPDYFAGLNALMPVPPRLYVKPPTHEMGWIIWRDDDRVLGVLMGRRTRHIEAAA